MTSCSSSDTMELAFDKHPPMRSARESRGSEPAAIFAKGLDVVTVPLKTNLPSSIRDGGTLVAAKFSDNYSRVYQWTPLHARLNESTVSCDVGFTFKSFSTGTYVNTLTMNLKKDGAEPHLLRLDSNNFATKGGKPWCYIFRGSIPFVSLTGVIVCTMRSQDKVHMIGRLPEGLRPTKTLRFAGLTWDESAERSATSSTTLVTLVCDPEGCVYAEAGAGDRGGIRLGSAIDLSAIRFCTGNGLSIVDGVMMYLCDVCGTRLACLQGSLHERVFSFGGSRTLALLPASAQPAQENLFITPGSNGGFHLLCARPHGHHSSTCDVVWKDSRWHRDAVFVNGLVWEVSASAVLIENPLCTTQATQSQMICVVDFQKFLRRRYGSIEAAWLQAFSSDPAGTVDFTDFCYGCKASGYPGKATKLWNAIDFDRSGEISMDELCADIEGVLQKVHGDRMRQLEDLQRSAEVAAPSFGADKTRLFNPTATPRGSKFSVKGSLVLKQFRG